MPRWILLLLLSLGTAGAREEDAYMDLQSPPISYWNRTPRDRFSQLKADLESGRISLDQSSEKAFVASLLELLEIPASSQLLVFSTSSLQIRLISTATPRALYFNEDIYLGYVRNGQIEVISLDPELGAIFHIFDIPVGNERRLQIEKSNRCMNCHAGPDTGYIPGLIAKSVIPGPNRGSLLSFRDELSGHSIPLPDRFGGWYVTGAGSWTNHWGNLVGRLFQGELSTQPVEPGSQFDWNDYPAATSDLLAHLIHEHQIGFVNRAVEAAYRAHTIVHHAGEQLEPTDEVELEEQAGILVRYLLFADEVPLPHGGVRGDETFRRDFLRNRRTNSAGESLKDFDLETRLFRNRCSYMIYSPLMSSLPQPLKSRVWAKLDQALSPGEAEGSVNHLSSEERVRIRSILKETLTDLPSGW